MATQKGTLAQAAPQLPKKIHFVLTGQRFGRLHVVSYFGKLGRNNAWLCRCDCGNEAAVRVGSLRSGHTKSCGCLGTERRKANIVHGGCRTPGYSSWNNMIRRCHIEHSHAYRHYGGRGIVVCERWRTSFWNFISDMGQRPTPKHSIDRIDNDGNYEPGNCRWAMAADQAKNTRSNKVIAIDGRTQCLSAWAEEAGIRYGTLRRRLSLGWSISDALAKKTRKKARSGTVREIKRKTGR